MLSSTIGFPAKNENNAANSIAPHTKNQYVISSITHLLTKIPTLSLLLEAASYQTPPGGPLKKLKPGLYKSPSININILKTGTLPSLRRDFMLAKVYVSFKVILTDTLIVQRECN